MNPFNVDNEKLYNVGSGKAAKSENRVFSFKCRKYW